MSPIINAERFGPRHDPIWFRVKSTGQVLEALALPANPNEPAWQQGQTGAKERLSYVPLLDREAGEVRFFLAETVEIADGPERGR